MGVQPGAGRLHAAQSAVAQAPRAGGVCPVGHGSPRQRLRAPASHGDARHGAIRRLRHADVRSRAGTVESRHAGRRRATRRAGARGGGSSEVLGHVTPGAAALTGLVPGTPVVGGGADNACGAAGVGAITPGEAVASWGTSGTVLAPTAEPRVDPALRAHTFCHVAPGVWYVMGVVLSAGGALAWYRDQFARDMAGADQPDMRLSEEAAAIPPGADGVTFLPYLQGERTPHRDAALRAAFVGLSLAHSRAHLTRAVLEGVCFALRDSVSILQELGLAPSHLLLTGGGARSPLIRRLQADVFGLPVSTVNREEGPAYGAALLAAVGAGAFPDLAAAVRRTLTREPLAYPDAQAHRAYQALYDRFRASYPASRPHGNTDPRIG